MDTATLERRAKDRLAADAATMAAYVGAAAFVIAAAWFGLATKGVTTASEPVAAPGASVEEAQRRYFAWFVTTLHQERFYTAIAIVGFLCLAATAMFVRDLIGRDRAIVRIAASAVAAGAVLWIVGNVAQLGAHRAVGLLSTHDYTTEITSGIVFTFDTIDDAFEVTSFALMGLGMLLMARAAVRANDRAQGWTQLTALLGVATLGTVTSYLFPIGDLTDLLLVVVGVALLPAWLVWSGRRMMDPNSTAARR